MNKKGISLIVLVITIIVMIIIAGAIILSLSNGNFISKAKEANFKSNLKSIQEELGVYIASNIQMDGSYIYPTKSDIKSADKYGADVINFARDKVIYKTSDINEKAWGESLGIIVDYTDGLISNYKLNGNTLDSFGTNNGTTYGGITLTIDRLGKSNSAYSFNGSNSYIGVPYSATLTPTSQVTCSVWGYRADWSNLTGDTKLVSKTEVGGWCMLLDSTLIGSGYIGFIVYRVGVGYICPKYLYTGLSSGWHHFTGTYDGRYTKFYIDGVLKNTIDSVTNSDIGYQNNNSLIIGAESSGGNIPAGEYFNGYIDDVRVYSRALSDTEISSLYNVYWAD